jgi:hypothetical protein
MVAINKRGTYAGLSLSIAYSYQDGGDHPLTSILLVSAHQNRASL